MQSTTLSKYRNRARTLTFGLEKQADFFSSVKEIGTPFFCPICETVMSNSIDIEAYDRVNCCRACENDFAETNLKAWSCPLKQSDADERSNARVSSRGRAQKQETKEVHE